MRMTGWSMKCWPTAGRSRSTPMPSARSAAPPPMPERSRIAGEWMAPAHNSTARAGIVAQPAPGRCTRTPTARPCASTTRSTSASPITSRFGRPRAGSRKASFVDTRRPPRLLMG